jgi:hypothetical protein
MALEDPVWKNPYQRFGFINVNVLVGTYPNVRTFPHRDLELFFGPLHQNDIFVDVPAGWTLAKLMAHLGIFESTKEAGRHGFNKPIPEGFTDIVRIRKMHRVTILKITKPEERPEGWFSHIAHHERNI